MWVVTANFKILRDRYFTKFWRCNSHNFWNFFSLPQTDSITQVLFFVIYSRKMKNMYLKLRIANFIQDCAHIISGSFHFLLPAYSHLSFFVSSWKAPKKKKERKKKIYHRLNSSKTPLQAGTNPLHKYVPRDSKQIKYTITLPAYLHRTQELFE